MKILYVLAAVWMTLMLVACGGGGVNPTLPAPALQPISSATFIATGVRPTLFKPLPKEECQALNDGLAAAFRVQAGFSEGPFNDPVTGDLGNGCLLDLRGTGEEFGSVTNTLSNLRKLLGEKGWQEDKQYYAEKVTSGSVGFRKDKAILWSMVEWQPAPDSNCPPAQAATCKLTPKQQRFTLSVKTAQR